jgi:sarcosine oxidase subunit gamma
MAEPITALSAAAFPHAGVTLRALPPCTRLSLRCRPEEAGVLGLALPPLLTASRQAGRAALALGPDEWLLLADDIAPGDWAAAILAAAGDTPVSVVDVSHRQVALVVEGPQAALLLAEGCPLDLSDQAFPPGSCTRTLFGKVEITLWRPMAAPAFHLEAGRSVAPHLWSHLVEAAADLDRSEA